MFCENCGGKLRQENDSLICTKCGSEFGLDYMEGYEEYAKSSHDIVVTEKATTEAIIPSADVAVAAGDAAVAPRGFSSKKHILLIAIGAIVAVGIIVFGIIFGTSYSRKQSVAQGFEIAERYLSELKYEQAVIEYLNILEIEPMNVEAYLGLAEAYIGMGEYEKALEVLNKGYEMTSDDTLKGDIMVRAYLGWGQSLVDEKQYEKAIETLDEGYELTNDQSLKDKAVDMYMSWSQYLVDEKKHETAIEILNKGYEASKNDRLKGNVVVNVYLNWAKMYADNGNKEKAIEILKEGFEKTGDQRLQDMIDELSKPVYGSMGFVTIAGIEVDVATTTVFSGVYTTLTKADINAIMKLVNLTQLNLEFNNISDISSLANLTNLTHLVLSDNNVYDISPLANLTDLTQLYLDDNNISDISPLAGLTNLTQLDLYNNNISDITALASLTNLTILNLWNNDISDISPLAELTNLTKLYLMDNNISDSDIEWLKRQLPNCEIRY